MRSDFEGHCFRGYLEEFKMRQFSGIQGAFASLVAVGALSVSGHAAADVATVNGGGGTVGTVTLNTLVLEARLPSNQLQIGRCRGTGSMDPVIAQISPKHVIVADTASVQFNGDSGEQGMLSL